MNQSTEIKELATALAAAQKLIKVAAKESVNPHFKNRYADLAEVFAACKQGLYENGISVLQAPGYRDGLATLTTRLLHSSGQWIEGEAACRVTKDDAQGYGSAITYLRRYCLAAMVGVVSEIDDDGNEASRKDANQVPYQPPAAKGPYRPVAPGKF